VEIQCTLEINKNLSKKMKLHLLKHFSGFVCLEGKSVDEGFSRQQHGSLVCKY